MVAIFRCTSSSRGGGGGPSVSLSIPHWVNYHDNRWMCYREMRHRCFQSMNPGSWTHQTFSSWEDSLKNLKSNFSNVCFLVYTEKQSKNCNSMGHHCISPSQISGSDLEVDLLRSLLKAGCLKKTLCCKLLITRKLKIDCLFSTSSTGNVLMFQHGRRTFK